MGGLPRRVCRRVKIVSNSRSVNVVHSEQVETQSSQERTSSSAPPPSQTRPFFPSLLKNLLLTTTSAIALVLLLILIGIWQTGNNLFSGIEALFTTPQPAPQVQIPTFVVDQVRGASELTTAIFAMEAVVPAEQERILGNVVIGTTKILYVAYGEVRAGVDLRAIGVKDITVTAEAVEIRLPPPRILDSKIDVEKSHVYDYDRGFLGLGPDVAPQLQMLAERKTLQKILTTACTQGVLERANERAVLVVKELFLSAGYQQVEVKTTPPASQACQVES